jgi:hypothetical protein
VAVLWPVAVVPVHSDSVNRHNQQNGMLAEHECTNGDFGRYWAPCSAAGCDQHVAWLRPPALLAGDWHTCTYVVCWGLPSGPLQLHCPAAAAGALIVKVLAQRCCHCWALQPCLCRTRPVSQTPGTQLLSRRL